MRPSHLSALLLTFAASWACTLAAGLPKGLALTVPPDGTTTAAVWQVGVDDTDVKYQSGYSRNLTLALTLPNGTTVPPGGVGSNSSSDASVVVQGCPLYPGAAYKFGRPLEAQNMSGEFLLTVTVTYGLGAGGKCAVPFTYQTETVSTNFTIAPAPDGASSGQGIGSDAPATTTTVAFGTAPTGTFAATSPAQRLAPSTLMSAAAGFLGVTFLALAVFF